MFLASFTRLDGIMGMLEGGRTKCVGAGDADVR
jgi:hypothetical protein